MSLPFSMSESSIQGVLTCATYTGVEVTDTVTLSPGLTVSGQSIGVSAVSSGFASFDGVLGYVQPMLESEIRTERACRLGPVGLSVGSLTPQSGAQVATGE